MSDELMNQVFVCKEELGNRKKWRPIQNWTQKPGRNLKTETKENLELKCRRE